MAKLTILRGVSGSGKSTWARQQNAIVVSRDDFRLAAFGSDGPEYYEVDKDVLREREDYISVVEQAAIRAALVAGKDVVSDNTHTMMKYVNRVAKIGYALDAEVELKVFDIPLAVCLKQVDQRRLRGGRAVPVDAIRRQHDQLAGSKSAVLTPPPAITPYNGTPGKPKAFIVDIDGTLAHMHGKRGPFEWHNVGVDDLDEVVANAADAFWSSGLNAIVMSGRDEVCRDETTHWLNDNDIMFDALFMRPEKDMRPDNIIKHELFDRHVRDNYDVKFVLDDRQQVVDMWRKMGLSCFQVAPSFD